MALTLEVFNSQIAAADGTSNTINLSTSGVDRVALLFVHTDAATRRTVSSVSDVNGLTWALYTAFNFDSEDPTNHKQRLEVWWAYCAAQQSANVVTVTISGSAHGPNLGIGAVAGLPATRFAHPFDADASLPQTASNPSATPASTALTFSTHDSRVAALAIFGGDVTNQAPATPSGWTALISLNGLVSFSRVELYVFGQVYAAQQVNTVVDMGSKVDFGVMAIAAGGDIIYPHAITSTPGF